MSPPGPSETFTLDAPAPRLDACLAARPSVGSRSRARDVLARGKVVVDGQEMSPEQGGLPLPAGATVTILWSRPGTSRTAARADRNLRSAGLRVLYEDDVLLAVDKPPRLLTDAADREQAERDTAFKRVQAWLAPRGQRGWLCHRIDRDTSGCVLFAKDEALCARVRDAFAAHEPERVYLAAVHGGPTADAGTWTDVMTWDPNRRRQVRVGPEHPQAVQASATWRVLERFAHATWLEVRLHTGRRNQIRLHAMLRGLPLIGEAIYLPAGWPPRLARPFPRQALHATRLTLAHPVTGEPVTVEAPLPHDLVVLLGELRAGWDPSVPAPDRSPQGPKGARRRRG